MNRPHISFLLLFTFGLGCASEEPKDLVEDMNLDADIENDAGVSDLSDLNLPDVPDDLSVNCLEVPVEDCIQFFGECQTVRLYEWVPEMQCFGQFEAMGLCLPMDDVWDDGQHAIVDPRGTCWGILEGLAQAPPGWSQFYGVSCACIKGDQVIEDCTDSWDFCPE